ncbi:hypothetical protein Z043_119038, partial [Scleropages formosus]
RWVLQQVLRQCRPCPQGAEHKEMGQVEQGQAQGAAQAEQLQRLLQEEMQVCSDAAGRYPSNYNAWSHRIWVLQNLARGNLKILHDELSSMKLWVSMHVSDHSGFHYRQFLLKALVGEITQAVEIPCAALQAATNQHCAHWPNEDGLVTATVPELFDDEMELCTDLIETYPGHETLWCHRRHVFFLWHHWRKEHLQSGGHPPSPLNHTDEMFGSSLDASLDRSVQAMDIDLAPDSGRQGGYTQDTKRLKRGPMQACPGLPSEHSFVTKILHSCRNTEQGRFAAAYRKWLDSVIGQ